MSENFLDRLERMVQEDEDRLYPVVLFTTRYQGVYEGAVWVALNEHVDYEPLKDAQGDDLTCLGFFLDYEARKPIGRGRTPENALQDLEQKLRENPEKAWPNS